MRVKAGLTKTILGSILPSGPSFAEVITIMSLTWLMIGLKS